MGFACFIPFAPKSLAGLLSQSLLILGFIYNVEGF